MNDYFSSRPLFLFLHTQQNPLDTGELLQPLTFWLRVSVATLTVAESLEGGQ